MGATTAHDAEATAEELPDEPGHELVPATPTAIGRVIGTDDPDEMLRTVGVLAGSLKQFVEQRRLAVDMGGGRKHVEVGAWQALGHLLGTLGGTPVHAETVWTRPMAAPNGEIPRVDFRATVKRYYKKAEGGGIKSETTYDVSGIEAWEACVQVCTADGTVVGRAEAMCSRFEETWSRRDDYALRSMAETRAESRAFRRALGFFMEAAGYSPTPREEMPPREPGADAVELPAWASPASESLRRTAVSWLRDRLGDNEAVKALVAKLRSEADPVPVGIARALVHLCMALKETEDGDGGEDPTDAARASQEQQEAALASEHGDEPEPTPEEIAASARTFPDDDIPF